VSGQRTNFLFLLMLCLACVLSRSARSAELKQNTADAFERYIRATEARMQEDLNSAQRFLWIDRMPEERRDALHTVLREGQLYIEQLKTSQNGKDIEIPNGLVHHWVGIIFIPGVTLQRTLAVLQDYDNHQIIYGPYVRRSKLLRRDGNDIDVFLQFYRKAIVTVVLNAEFQVHYDQVDPVRVQSRSYSTRIAEIENAGRTSESEKPPGKDHGYLWRLYTYSRLEEKDGGVYFQLESIALTRRIPIGLGWLINPFVKRIPRESLSMLLSATRKAAQSGAPEGTSGLPPYPEHTL
jgi:hypothetical protein